MVSLTCRFPRSSSIFCSKASTSDVSRPKFFSGLTSFTDGSTDTCAVTITVSIKQILMAGNFFSHGPATKAPKISQFC